MTVDVIIPVYNQFEFARQCIQSVLTSLCSTTFRVVVFDDASTDPRIGEFLRSLETQKAITLVTNQQNLGFTRTVNSAMARAGDRDVLLLNSDTLVYGAWLDRIVAGVYSERRIATANPLTNQNGSHISCYPRLLTYPRLVETDDGPLEVNDETLNGLAARVNAGRHVDVHTTNGFCMFIRRECLNEVGSFDAVHFPVAYGEESDFCYRARKVGWRHLIIGDAFVTHFQGKTFGEAKVKLMQDMMSTFTRLHPEFWSLEDEFRRRDPVRALRARLDLARVKRILAGRGSLGICMEDDGSHAEFPVDDVQLAYSPREGSLKFVVRGSTERFPNLDPFAIPNDLSRFNSTMRYLGVEAICCRSHACMAAIERNVKGLPIEVTIGPNLLVGTATPATSDSMSDSSR